MYNDQGNSKRCLKVELLPMWSEITQLLREERVISQQ